MPENSTHKCTNAVNNVQPIRNSSLDSTAVFFVPGFDFGFGLGLFLDVIISV